MLCCGSAEVCGSFVNGEEEDFYKTLQSDEASAHLLLWLLHCRKVEISSNEELDKIRTLADSLGYHSVVDAINRLSGQECPLAVCVEDANIAQARAMGFFADKNWFTEEVVTAEATVDGRLVVEALSGQRYTFVIFNF